MPLYHLLEPRPDDETDLNRWAFAHSDQHNLVNKNLLSKKNVSLIYYSLDPYNKSDVGGWDLRHQQSHDDINSALNIAGIDFSAINTNTERGKLEWAALHFKEHQLWNQILGI